MKTNQNFFRISSFLAVLDLFAIATILVFMWIAIGPMSQSTDLSSMGAEPDLYQTRVQSVFDRRCVQCHSCNNAPCQLNLTSYEGLLRGASKTVVYQPTRLIPIDPTRIGIDAHGITAWRQKGFFPVIDFKEPTESPLLRALEMKRENESSNAFNDRDALKVKDSNQCPSKDEFGAFAANRPLAGMPYMFRSISPAEFESIRDWFDNGAPSPKTPLWRADEAEREMAAKWQAFLNGTDAKSKLVARYIYEHLFLGHIHLDKSSKHFYRLVRSRTACDHGINEIATRRPNDDPQGVVYYCLQPFTATIVEKTHIPYLFDQAKLEWMKSNFYSENWQVQSPMTYDPVTSANPFRTFRDIPVLARYRFILEDSAFHISGFIKGPVCNGHAAVSSIDEQFYTFFMQPESDLMVRDAKFRAETEDLLVLPAEQGSDPSILDGFYFLKRYPSLRHEYRKTRQAVLKAKFPSGLSLKDLWDGEGKNPNAMVTVFRHDDHSYVLQGAHGDASATAFVLDYALFERIIYNLVVGFDVFGNLPHQLHTRVYMGMIRMEGENNFLDFMPPQFRQPLRETWYSSRILGKVEKLVISSRLPDDNRSQIALSSTNPIDARNELYSKILSERIPHMVTLFPDPFNWRKLNVTMPSRSFQPDEEKSRPLARLASRAAESGANFVYSFPDTVLVAIDEGARINQVWTVARNKYVKEIGSMFFEKNLRDPRKDSLVLIRDLATSYPNYIFVVPEREIETFVQALEAVKSPAAFTQVMKRWGRAPEDPRFWVDSDRLHDYLSTRLGPDFGVLDYTRYDLWSY